MFGEKKNLYIYPFHIHNVEDNFAKVIEKELNYRFQKKVLPMIHPWFDMAITWDGRVVLCCHDILYTHIVENKKLFNKRYMEWKRNNRS